MTGIAASPRASIRHNRRTTERMDATEVRCTRRVHLPNDVHQIVQAAVKERVSADIRQFPIKDIARITGASTDTVKAWRTDPPRRFPSWENLKRLEPHLVSVQEYVAHEFPNSTSAAHPESPEALDKIASALLRRIELRGRID